MTNREKLRQQRLANIHRGEDPHANRAHTAGLVIKVSKYGGFRVRNSDPPVREKQRPSRAKITLPQFKLPEE